MRGVVKVLPGGTQGGVDFWYGRNKRRGNPGHAGAKPFGWTPASAAGHISFLYSILCEQLTGLGIHIILTVDKVPEDPKVWSKLIYEYTRRLRRFKFVRMCGHTEWTAKNRPHFHLLVYTSKETKFTNPARFRWIWCEVAREFGAEMFHQRDTFLFDVQGFLKYIGKHAGRSIYHYQRCRENMPPKWREAGYTSRMWRYWGDWPRMDIDKIGLPTKSFCRMRRLFRTRWKAAARAAGDWRSLVKARRSLKCGLSAAKRTPS